MYATTRAGELDQAARSARPRPLSSSRSASTFGDHDAPAEREAVAQEAVQPPDAALQRRLLVEDGDDDVDGGHGASVGDVLQLGVRAG
jgi:hypothetical protein